MSVAPQPSGFTWTMPRPVRGGFALACLLLLLMYVTALEMGGALGKPFNLLRMLVSAAGGVGPALVLLMPVWGLTGWLEQRAWPPVKVIAAHSLLALAFTLSWQAITYTACWLIGGRVNADHALRTYLVWQALWGLMMYAAVAGGFSAYRSMQKARREAEQALRAQTLLSRAELMALRHRLNPHFLFNTLHSILALVRKDPAQAEGALQRFSDMLRHVLDTERRADDAVTLRDELDFTRDYLALESLRLGSRLSVVWQVDEAALAVRVPALSVQPLVENSIKHALNPRRTPGTVWVDVRCEAGGAEVQVCIADDGPGLADAALAQQADRLPGLGLSTVSKRLQMAFGARAALALRARDGGGFSVAFRIPAQMALVKA